MYVMSYVFHEAQNIRRCCICRLARPFSRNEVIDGHELGQKNEVEGQTSVAAANCSAPQKNYWENSKLLL